MTRTPARTFALILALVVAAFTLGVTEVAKRLQVPWLTTVVATHPIESAASAG